MAATVGVEVGDHLALLDAAIDGIADDLHWQLTDDQLLQRIDELEVKIRRLAGLRLRAIAEADRRKICEQQGWTTANRLVTADPQPMRTARATVALAKDLHRFGRVGDALAAGQVSTGQARAITRSLAELPATITDDELEQAQQMMIDHAARFDPAGLRRIGNHLVEVLSPDALEDMLGQQLSRQEVRARRDRYLVWDHTGDGSVNFRAKLPVLPGETLITLIDAYTRQAHARGLDQAIDPETETLTPAQRRADALITMTQDLLAHQSAPSVAGDRPRAVIMLQYTDLVAGIRGATLVGSGQPIAPGTARRIACSADLLPAVLDGPSTVLDLGRQVRLFAGCLRTALVLRDGGCVFPGCDAQPSRCEGHHIHPWWTGGRTALDNGVLLCSHHHDLIEPDPHAPPGSRWEIRLDPHGLPEVLPPRRIDPTRRPRQHTRYLERDIRRRR